MEQMAFNKNASVESDEKLNSTKENEMELNLEVPMKLQNLDGNFN